MLCDEHMPGLWVHVSAEVRDGCLRVSGQDLGSRVEEIMGRDEYEYFMDLDMKNTDRLFALLSVGEKDPREIFIQNLAAWMVADCCVSSARTTRSSTSSRPFSGVDTR